LSRLKNAKDTDKYQLAFFYNNFHQQEKCDNKDTIELFEYIDSIYQMGNFYYSKNHALPGNLGKAEYYYQQLLNLGDNQAFGLPGDIWYELKSSVSANPNLPEQFKEYCQKAQHYFEQGSKHNDLHSIQQLAHFYLGNKCLDKNEAQAIYYQEKLAKQINSTAMSFI